MSSSEKGTGIYVYCLIKSTGEKKIFGNIGFGGREVYTIDYKDFAPVISMAPLKKYDIEEEDIKVHQSVVRHVMNEHSVIPVAYGMVFKNKKIVFAAISVGYKAIKQAMQKVDNKIELGIKIVQPKDAPEWNGKTDELRLDFLESLKRVAAFSKERKLFSERLLWNASFLVEREKTDAFSSAVEQLENKYDCLKIQYSGPWPPYNFVDVNILSRRRGGFR
jgi:hypothetical protein